MCRLELTHPDPAMEILEQEQATMYIANEEADVHLCSIQQNRSIF